jgi:hypothetical protein
MAQKAGNTFGKAILSRISKIIKITSGNYEITMK